jgi:predicted transcriptional regulator
LAAREYRRSVSELGPPPFLAHGAAIAYNLGMTARYYRPDGTVHGETPAERAARLRWQVAEIERAEEELAAGLGIDEEALEAWLDELDRDPDAPVPGLAPSSSRRL